MTRLGLIHLEPKELRAKFDGYELTGGKLGAEALQSALQLVQTGEEKAVSIADARAVLSEIKGIKGTDADDGADDGADGGLTWDQFRAAVENSADQLDPRVRPISATMFLSFAGQGAMAPMLPLLARSLSLSPSEIGFFTAANSAARIVANVPMATLADLLGRRPLMIAGPALGGFAFGMISVSGSWTELAVWNALAGVGSAATMAAAGLYLSDISTPRNRARTLAPLMMTAMVGYSVGPAFSGVLAERYGLQAPFVVCSTGMALSALYSAVALPETKRSEEIAKGSPENPLKQWARLIKRSPLQGMSTLTFFSGFAAGASPVTGILLASETLGMGPSALGSYFAVSVLCMAGATPLVARAADQLSNRLQMIVPGNAGSAIALACQSISTTPESFVISGVCGSISATLSMNNVQAYVIDNTTTAERAQALAMNRMAQDVGVLCGAAGVGILSTFAGIPLAMQCTAGLHLVAAMWAAVRGKAWLPQAGK